jgi:hypothetical protein
MLGVFGGVVEETYILTDAGKTLAAGGVLQLGAFFKGQPYVRDLSTRGRCFWTQSSLAFS